MDPIIIQVAEAPGMSGLVGVISQIKNANPDPWAEEKSPIILEGSQQALSLIKLLRLDRIDGVTMKVL